MPNSRPAPRLLSVLCLSLFAPACGSDDESTTENGKVGSGAVPSAITQSPTAQQQQPAAAQSDVGPAATGTPAGEAATPTTQAPPSTEPESVGTEISPVLGATEPEPGSTAVPGALDADAPLEPASSASSNVDGGAATGGASNSEEGSDAGDAGAMTPYVPPVQPCTFDNTPLAVPASFCPMGPYVANPLPDDAQPVTLCEGLDWPEGPVWFASTSTLYFSNFDQRDGANYYNGSIMQYTDGEGCSEFLSGAGTNGLAVGLDGNLVAGRHVNRTISHFDLATGEACSLADQYDGSLLSSPNDLAVRSDGNIYFTDPAWNLGERVEELPQSVYRVDPAGNVSLVEVLDGERPNGINLSPDGLLLYVAVSRSIRVYDVAVDGTVANGREFVRANSTDGMAVDCAGNLYTSGGQIYSPQGESLGRFSGGTNLAFGGNEGQTLYIVGNGRLQALEMNIPGLPY